MIHRDQVLLQLIRFAEAVHDALVNRPDIAEHQRFDINNQYVHLAQMGDLLKNGGAQSAAPELQPERTEGDSTIICPVCFATMTMRDRRVGMVSLPRHRRAKSKGDPFDFCEKIADMCPASEQLVKPTEI